MNNQHVAAASGSGLLHSLLGDMTCAVHPPCWQHRAEAEDARLVRANMHNRRTMRVEHGHVYARLAMVAGCIVAAGNVNTASGDRHLHGAAPNEWQNEVCSQPARVH